MNTTLNVEDIDAGTLLVIEENSMDFVVSTSEVGSCKLSEGGAQTEHEACGAVINIHVWSATNNQENSFEYVLLNINAGNNPKMDELLVPLYRQYLQQVIPSNIRYPHPKLLVTPDVQLQIHRYLFDEASNEYLPPPEYQRRVLKKLITEIERELSRGGYDRDEYAVCDELMSHMGALSALPAKSESEAAQSPRILSYFAPTRKEESKIARRVLVRESPNLLAAGSNVGLRTWEACLRLAYYLCTFPELDQQHANHKDIKGANVIELGAGTGLLSLLCAQSLQANHVVVTDGLPHVVEALHANIEINADSQNDHATGKIVAAQLDWTNPADLEDVLAHDGQCLEYDYILGADITYHPELFDPLANIIRLLKKKFPKARVLIAATVRNEATLRNFRHVCTSNNGLQIREIEKEEWCCPAYVAQTGLFHEQTFPINIMEIDLKDE